MHTISSFLFCSFFNIIIFAFSYRLALLVIHFDLWYKFLIYSTFGFIHISKLCDDVVGFSDSFMYKDMHLLMNIICLKSQWFDLYRGKQDECNYGNVKVHLVRKNFNYFFVRNVTGVKKVSIEVYHCTWRHFWLLWSIIHDTTGLSTHTALCHSIMTGTNSINTISSLPASASVFKHSYW